MEFVKNGRKLVSTNYGVFKDKNFIWYDNNYILSLKLDEEKVEIVIKKIPKAGGEL